MKEKVLLVLKKAKKPIDIDKIYEKVGVLSDEDKVEVNKIIEEMLNNYDLYRTTNNRYSLLSKTSFRKGLFVANKTGGGYVYPNDNRNYNQYGQEKSYKISSDDAGFAINKDVVLIDLQKPKKGPATYKVVKIIERNLDNVVGTVKKVGDDYYLEPIIDSSKKLIIKLNRKDIAVGKTIRVNLIPSLSYNYYTANVTSVLDDENDPNADIIYEVFKNGFDNKFSEEAIKQVKTIPLKVRDIDKIGRMDLTDGEIFTIDGDDTKDIDDAVSCKRLPNGNYELGVHIADVSHYVPLDSPLDLEARKRGTSVYPGGIVVPMLPRELSNGICSLNPNEERLAISCIMELDNKGNVVSHNIYPSVIKSNLQMTYNKVNDILDKGIVDPAYASHVETLKLMKELAAKIRNNRHNRGAIDFDKSELKVINNDGNVSFDLRHNGTGENIIEDFMIVANETVDKHLSDRNIPCIHRIHDKPNPERLKEFLRLLDVIGYKFDKYDADTCVNNPKALQSLSEFVKTTGDLQDTLSNYLIKCMAKARYSMNNIGHAGLASTNYSHFTSPIRRYPDLTVHRILKDSFDESKIGACTKKWEKLIPPIAITSSAMEKNADNAERDVLLMKEAEFMSKHIGEKYNGIVEDISDKCMQIKIDNSMQGILRIRNLKGIYNYDPETYTLCSSDSRLNDYHIGDHLEVEVVAASKEKKTIDFKLAYNEKNNGDKIHNVNKKNKEYVKSPKVLKMDYNSRYVEEKTA
jgi:ribonuclease R